MQATHKPLDRCKAPHDFFPLLGILLGGAVVIPMLLSDGHFMLVLPETRGLSRRRGQQRTRA